MERGWNPKTRAFTQDYSSEVLDSSLLMMPLQGFVRPGDPMWLLDPRGHGPRAGIRQPRLPL